ncbi:hypothetical protein [Burkholderia cepacia]|nr:hypothetical protein [Burkholderia cepacia]
MSLPALEGYLSAFAELRGQKSNERSGSSSPTIKSLRRKRPKGK